MADPIVHSLTPSDTVTSTPEFIAAEAIVRALRNAGYSAYFAGGSVRDMLLGRTLHDIDIATDAHPEHVLTLFPGSHGFGKSFGVVQVNQDTFQFEVATYRRDMNYEDGRRPSDICFTTAEEDAQRRDFTVNGMFFDPVESLVIDYVEGLSDISAKTIRAIGKPMERFFEDHLRIMRAIRFANVLEFTIHEQTWQAVQKAAHLLSHISIERIRDELMRTLMEAPHPGEALSQLSTSGILPVILPEIEAMHGVEQPPEYHPEGDVFQHVCLMLEKMNERSPEIIWAILMHDVAKPSTFAIGTDKQGLPRIQFYGHAEKGAVMAAEIMRRFRCANDQIEAVSAAVRNHMRFSAVPDMRNATLRKWVGAATFPLELELHRIDCLGCHGLLNHYEQIKEFQKRIAAEPVLPPPLIRGKDLMDRGVPSGPLLGRMLKNIYDQQLDGVFSSREEADQWVNQHLPTLKDQVQDSTDIQP